MIATELFEQVPVASADEFHRWLEANHAREESVWLVTWKKADPARYIPHEAVLDALIAFGWTDGLMRKLDTTIASCIALLRSRAECGRGARRATMRRPGSS